VKQNQQDRHSAESLRKDRAGSVFVVVGHQRKCLGCDRLMTQAEAARHSPSLCYRSEPGIELHGRVIVSAAQARPFRFYREEPEQRCRTHSPETSFTVSC